MNRLSLICLGLVFLFAVGINKISIYLNNTDIRRCCSYGAFYHEKSNFPKKYNNRKRRLLRVYGIHKYNSWRISLQHKYKYCVQYFAVCQRTNDIFVIITNFISCFYVFLSESLFYKIDYDILNKKGVLFVELFAVLIALLIIGLFLYCIILFAVRKAIIQAHYYIELNSKSKES